MSAIAEVLLRLGYRVSGSDEAPSEVTARLARLGLAFFEGHAAAHVKAVDVVVASTAVKSGNPEIVEARRRGIPVIARAEMLGALMRPKFGIAVAGAHGKTTTTAMVALMLERAGVNPTAVIGGRLSAFGSNARVGEGDVLVAEADESDRSFLRLAPSIAVVTNIDREHLESYAGFDDLVASFVAFANLVPFYGAAVICGDDPHLERVRPQISARVIAYGLDSPDLDVTAADLTSTSTGSTLAVHRRAGGATEVLGELRLHVPGRHNVLNALAAVSVGLELGLPFDALAPGLEAFRGADRRFERKGEAAGVTVVDDYGHHPTEIAAVLEAARAGLDGRLIVAFQPHRYTRTQQLRDAFGPALAKADAIVLTDIYAAGEAPIAGVTLDWLAAAVERAAPGRVHVVPALADVPAAVARLARAGDLIVTLGAGSIGTLGPLVLEELAACQ
jgi:UDP-N-acetylmuramate--alanine ligase